MNNEGSTEESTVPLFREGAVIMGRGKNINDQEIMRIMTAYALNTNNIAEAARVAGVPESTARKVINEHKDEPFYVELCRQKKEEYSDQASELIELTLQRIKERLQNPDQIPLNQLSTTFGILMDKKAIADGDPVQRIEILTPEALKQYGS